MQKNIVENIKTFQGICTNEEKYTELIIKQKSKVIIVIVHIVLS